MEPPPDHSAYHGKTAASLSRRKRARQPTSLTHDTLTPPAGLRYPTQLLHAARTGHTPLLSLPQLSTRHAQSQRALQAALQALPAPSVPAPSLDAVRLPAPWRLIAERVDGEVGRVGDWLRDAEGELLAEARRRAEAGEREWTELKRKEREERMARRKREREVKGVDAVASEAKEEAGAGAGEAVKDERKESVESGVAAVPSTPAMQSAAQQAEQTEGKDARADPPGDEVKEVSESTPSPRPTPKRPRKSARTFSASLSSPSTATSALQLTAGVDLPPSFGTSVPSHAELMAALLPEKALAALPLSLFPPVVDFNSLTPELFLHRLRKKLVERGDESKEAALGSIPLGTPLLRVSVYAAASDRKQQEVIVHGEQTLDELMAVIRCSVKHQPLPTPPSSSSSLPPNTATPAPTPINTEFLYIEHTLYPAPTTPPAALDPILAFLTAHATTSPYYPPAVQPSHTSLFASLTLRLGSHYLYHHGVDCCHVLVVDDVQFASGGGGEGGGLHVLERVCYPLVVWERGERRRLCGGCRMASAVCCVYGDMLSDVEPLLLCDGCERLLHRDSQGSHLYDNYTMYRL